MLVLIVVFQFILYGVQRWPMHRDTSLALDTEIQKAIDSLKRLQKSVPKKEFTVNPNYLTDYQGYRLGLSLETLDTILSYRSAGGFINSLDQFRQVTGLPDSTLERLTPLLRFPPASKLLERTAKRESNPRDLNAATARDLQEVYGIGPVFSARILKFREALGGFVHDDQVYDVYGLDSAVVSRLLDRFTVQEQPVVEKLSVNTATVEELAANVYISWDLAREIVAHRKRLAGYESWEELAQVVALPGNRIERIRLYLSLEKKLLE